MRKYNKAVSYSILFVLSVLFWALVTWWFLGDRDDSWTANVPMERQIVRIIRFEDTVCYQCHN